MLYSLTRRRISLAAALALPASGLGVQGTSNQSCQLSVFSWWTGGGEAAGLDRLIKIWNRQNPDCKFKNETVAGGAGTNAKAVLAQRLAAGNPPDSFQGHAGAELRDYIKAGQVLPVDFIYRQALKAKSLDAVRGVLPAASLSNVGIYGTGQGYESLLLRMRAHPLPEARSYADLMLTELRKVIPSFLKRVDLTDRGVAASTYLAGTRTHMEELAERLFPDEQAGEEAPGVRLAQRERAPGQYRHRTRPGEDRGHRQIARPQGLTTDAAGHIFVTSLVRNKVLCYDRDGNLIESREFFSHFYPRGNAWKVSPDMQGLSPAAQGNA